MNIGGVMSVGIWERSTRDFNGSHCMPHFPECIPPTLFPHIHFAPHLMSIMFPPPLPSLPPQERVFELGERGSVLEAMEERPAVIPHMVEAEGTKLTYELIFR